MKDVQYTNNTTGDIPLVVLQKTSNAATILYQRIICLLCSNAEQPYRAGQGSTLTDLLVGGNMPSQQALTSFAKIAQREVLNELDQQDLDLIQNMTMQGITTTTGINLGVYITFTDGTIIQGIVQ